MGLLIALPPFRFLPWLRSSVACSGQLGVEIGFRRGHLWTHSGTKVSHSDGGCAIPVLLERVLKTRQRRHSNNEQAWVAEEPLRQLFVVGRTLMVQVQREDTQLGLDAADYTKHGMVGIVCGGREIA